MRDWTREEIQRIGYQVVDLIADHLSNLPSERVFLPVPPALARQFITTPAPLDAVSPEDMLRAFQETIEPYPFGNGHRGSEFLSAKYLDPKWLSSSGGRSSHNTFLTALVEQGIPGAILYIAFVVWGWRSVKRLKQMSRTGEFTNLTLYGAAAAAGLTIVLVAGIFEDLLKTEVQIWLAALLCAIFQMSAVVAKRETETAPVAKPANSLAGKIAVAPRYAARRD